MAEPTGQNVESKKDWALTRTAFHQLLDWLDEGSESSGQRYLEMRRRLAIYFDRKNCHSPDDLADETLTRVARRMEEEGAITSDTPAHYCYIVARFVFLEHLRKAEREEYLDEVSTGRLMRHVFSSPDANQEQREKERRMECLERCSREIEPGHRELILSYYCGEQRAKIDNRRAMAEKLKITMNALSIRAFRIRDKLETCVHKCLDGG